MDELDVNSAETKAIYDEIKAYVLEQTAGIAEKYAEKMGLDTLPDPDRYYRQKQIQDSI